MLLGLAESQSLFRTRVRIHLPSRDNVIEFRVVRAALAGLTLLESKVVGDAKEPATKIVPRAAELEVPEQREKHILNDLLPVVHRQADGKQYRSRRLRCSSNRRMTSFSASEATESAAGFAAPVSMPERLRSESGTVIDRTKLLTYTTFLSPLPCSDFLCDAAKWLLPREL
jgi:hypothetical protein